ncbi:neuropeptide FF receptor 2-like [Oculina patagonica]
MNISDNNNATGETVDEAARKATLGIFVLTFVFGSTGNLLVLLVVAKKHTRTINDTFIVHLAVSDLSFILLCLPVFIYMQVSDFRGSLVYCKIIWPMMTVSFCAGIFTVTLMAVHRCKAILRPFDSTLEKRKLALCFVVIWILSFLVALPLIIIAKVGPSGYCHEDWPTSDHKRAYTAVLAGLQYFVPLIIIAVAYIRIGGELFFSKRRSSFTSQARTAEEARKQENKKIAKILATIVASFAVCMLPTHVAWLLVDFGGKSGQEKAEVIFKFSDLLAVFHSCLNPVIYGTVTRQFRQDYVRYLSFIFCCKKTTNLPKTCQKGCCVEIIEHTRQRAGYNTCSRSQDLLEMNYRGTVVSTKLISEVV